MMPPPSTNPPALRRDLRLITLAWVFGSGWLWIASGAAMTQFAKAVGMPDWGFGLLAATPFIAALAQLPAGWWIDTYGRRRTFFLWTCILGRLMTTVVALVPWLLPGFPDAWWQALVVGNLLGWVLMQAAGPAWMNWMSDVIPRRLRGRYFARRVNLAMPVAVAASLGAAWLLDEAQASASAGALRDVAALLLAGAGVLGALDGLTFLWVKDPRPQPRPGEARAFTAAALFAPLRDRGFRTYLCFNGALTFSIAFIGQYVWLYVLDHLGWRNLGANLLIIAVPLVAQALTRPAWGRACDRLGKKPVMIITGLLTTFGAVGWVLMTPTDWWLGYALVLLVTLAWPGMELANFNFLLDFASHAERGHGRPHAGGAAAVGLFSAVNAVAGALSGVLAATIAASLEDWTLATGVLGIVLTYHGVLFLLSTVLRGAAVVFIFGLEEPSATGTRDAVRYVAGGVWNNVRSVALAPARIAGPALGWAYRIDR